jgi:uncharacterized phage protein (TIGR01671 family)
MREIKFRAWLRSKKEMLHWRVMTALPFNQAFHQKGNHIIYDCIERNNVSVSLGEEEAEITMMQFTGMKDRDKNDIYEGDVLQPEYSRRSRKMEVVWNNDDACYDVHVHYPNGMVQVERLFKNMNHNIIGNKYENPDLLEVEG